MSPRRRWSLLLVLLALACALALFGQRSGPASAIVDAATPAGSPQEQLRTPAPTAAAPTIAALRPRTPLDRLSDIFASLDWTPPPPPPPPPPPAAAPRAPPLPYTVLGKKLEDGQWQVFLARQEQIFIAKPKMIIEDNYRVEAIQPPAMTLTYLPLKQQQILPIGEAE